MTRPAPKIGDLVSIHFHQEHPRYGYIGVVVEVGTYGELLGHSHGYGSHDKAAVKMTNREGGTEVLYYDSDGWNLAIYDTDNRTEA